MSDADELQPIPPTFLDAEDVAHLRARFDGPEIDDYGDHAQGFDDLLHTAATLHALAAAMPKCETPGCGKIATLAAHEWELVWYTCDEHSKDEGPGVARDEPLPYANVVRAMRDPARPPTGNR